MALRKHYLLPSKPTLSIDIHYTPFRHPHQETNYIPLIARCSCKPHLLQLHARLLRLPPPGAGHFNALLRAYTRFVSPACSQCLFARMHRARLRADAVTSSLVLKSCAKTLSLGLGRQLHSTILRDGQQRDCLLLTSLMGVYSCCGMISDAVQLFDEMPVRDTVAWNVLISCCIGNKKSKDAMMLFDTMQEPEHGCDPDDVTCLHLLQAAGNLGALEFGQRLHRYADESGYGGALTVQNSLIAMYSRCGCIAMAYRVFSSMRNKSVVSWSALISGMAMNGFGRDAIEAFMEMRGTGVTPDEHTFTGVLSACSHSRLVDEGRRFFGIMKAEYGIAPNVCHYGCMVDLLGRAGLVNEAYELVATDTKVKPDATIWRTLLGACRIHKDVELGERVIEQLIELKAQEAGDYVLLLNIYSSVGNWAKVAEVRKLMKDKDIQTTPGCSTIELKGVIHEFIVDDELHPRKEEIYAVLGDVEKQLKIDGYVVNVEAELHDMEVERKKNALSYHSEKLAIAFGMVATPPGTTLRIAKNHRICIDCHTFCKVFSSVYSRVLIVRDRNRFHHFREGLCSCNDYW